MSRTTYNKVTQDASCDNLAKLVAAGKGPDASSAAVVDTDYAVKVSGDEGERT